MFHHGPSSNGRSSPTQHTEQFTIELTEDPTFYRETIAFAKQHVEEKPHIPYDQQRLVFDAPPPKVDDTNEDVEMFMNSSWWEPQSNLLTPQEPTFIGKEANLLDVEERLMPVPQESEDDFFLWHDDLNMIEPDTKRQKFEHEVESERQNATKNNDQRNQILNLLISEQKKQGKEILELKQMVQNLTRQLEARLANNQIAQYQIRQQQQFLIQQQQLRLQQAELEKAQKKQEPATNTSKKMAPARRK